MAISEAQRFQVHVGLRRVLGDDVADTMMEYMPPVGWADVARRSDIEHLEKRMDHLDGRIKGVVNGLWAVGSLTATGFIGLFTLIATKL